MFDLPVKPCFCLLADMIKIMKRIKLSSRLQALADHIDENASVADIGTDHGYLPVYLAQTDTVKSIAASDISSSSLESARRSAAEYNVTDKIKFINAPGLDGISPNEADTIVIAGMGGETIIGILKDAGRLKHHGIKLILQPQTKLDLLSRFLYDDGYKIADIIRLQDKGKNYVIIIVKS